MAKAKRNWIQEERRKTLGDWVAFCLTCGHTLRYFLEDENELPAACPQCAGELAPPLPELRGSDSVRVRGRVRGVRCAGPRGRALRHGDSASRQVSSEEARGRLEDARDRHRARSPGHRLAVLAGGWVAGLLGVVLVSRCRSSASRSSSSGSGCSPCATTGLRVPTCPSRASGLDSRHFPHPPSSPSALRRWPSSPGSSGGSLLNDLREANERDDLVFVDLAVVELAQEPHHLVDAPDLRVVVLDLAG